MDNEAPQPGKEGKSNEDFERKKSTILYFSYFALYIYTPAVRVHDKAFPLDFEKWYYRAWIICHKKAKNKKERKENKFANKSWLFI